VMNDGNVEQLGTPTAVYERPANEFVADFVGTSNRIPATVRNGTIDLGHTSLDAPTGIPEGAVTVVARPEAFTLDGGPVEATIENRFYVGEHVRAIARTPDDTELTLRFDPGRLPEDPQVSLSVDPERLHVLSQ